MPDETISKRFFDIFEFEGLIKKNYKIIQSKKEDLNLKLPE